MTKRARAVAVLMASVGLVAMSAEAARAQARVVVPISIPAPPAGSTLIARPPSVTVTTRTASPQPGVTTTPVTVRDTTGAMRSVGTRGVTSQLGTASLARQTVTITSTAPIDAPIVILTL
jgi:hypothetical protein